jgi:diacylglycerol kinase family enzyme
LTTRRLLVIWNGSAGGRGGGGDASAAPDPVLQEVRDGLRDRGVEAEIFESPSEAATRERIAQARGGGGETGGAPRPFDAIVAAGGDHTVRSVAFELIGTDQPLGILPLGTAMNIARSLDLPLEIDGALDVLATGAPRPIDVGYVGDQPFLEVVSIGLAADLLNDATAVSEGRLRAAFDLLNRFVRHRRTRVWLDLDGRAVFHRVVTLAIANGRFSGRALEVAPDARIDDGMLDVTCYLGFGPLEVLKQLAKVVLGLGSGTRSVSYRARRVGVRSHHPLPIRADSIDVGTTPTAITINAGMVMALTRVART